jgi:MFS family permease
VTGARASREDDHVGTGGGMSKWTVVAILGAAQFVMVLDSTVMNVSISTVVEDLDTTVNAMQAAITFYTLTMAALMLLGAKLGDVWGRLRAFVIGSIVYAIGSLTTALAPNITVLFLGWSVVEGMGAVLVIPAIAALVADNYEGRARISAYAIIGAVSGAAVAAGPLIGGYLTTYASWRYVFVGEVVIMAVVVLFARKIVDKHGAQHMRIDLLSVLLSAAGLIGVVFGMLQSKTWGWVIPLQSPEVNGVEIAPLGVSLTSWFILAGCVLIGLFFRRQRHLLAQGRPPLLDVTLFSITRLRSGLGSLMLQYTITAGIFFMVPVYLQMTLGLDALETGIRIFPLSISLILFSIVGTRLAAIWSPKRIVRIGQLVLVLASFVLLGSVDLELKSFLFAAGMFVAGAALGLLASQLGNVNMSSVDEEKSSEVGGMQGVFQNLGSSLGTALIGSVLITALATSFGAGVASSDLPAEVQGVVVEATAGGVEIVPAASVDDLATEAGLSADDAATLQQVYSQSQVESLRVAFVALTALALLALLFSRGIPDEVLGRKPEEETPDSAAEPVAGDGGSTR